MPGSPEPRRIYLVTPGGRRGRGGIGRLVSYLVDGWERADLPLTVVDSYGPGSQAAMPFYFATALARILADGMAGRIGLLHVNMAERLSVVRKGLVVHLGRALGIPVVLHLHGAELAEYVRALSPRRRRRMVRMMNAAQRIVALGDYWSRFVTDELGLPADKVTVLHNAVPGPAEPPVRRSDGVCRLLFLGVLSDRKGMDVLVEALARLPSHLAWQLTAAGNGDVERYRARVAALGLTDRVTFAGWVDTDAARRLLTEADLFVLPSRNEGLPMAVLEAMSHGLPIVSTPVGSIADAVEDGACGRIVPAGDAVALAEALTELVADGERRLRYGREARLRYEQRFSLTSFNARLAEIFEAALTAGRTPPLTSRFASGRG